MSFKKVSIMAVVAILSMSLNVMATDAPENPSSWMMALGSNYWSSSTVYTWDYSGNEPSWNSRKYKTYKIVGPFSGGPGYVVVKSANPWGGDPRLYYKSGSTWTALSDDEGEGVNFRAVIHFNGAMPSVSVDLLYNHYSTGDTADYQFSHTVSNNDPGETGCYYLEVYSDGSMSKVWH